MDPLEKAHFASKCDQGEIVTSHLDGFKKKILGALNGFMSNFRSKAIVKQEVSCI